MKYRENPLLKYSGVKVLLLDGALAQSLPLIKHFGRLGCEVYVLCGSKLDVGYASRYTHHKILKELNGLDEYALKSILLDTVKETKFDIVFPLMDNYAFILSKYKDEFSKYTKVYVNDFDTFIKAFDKSKTMQRCMEIGIPCPKTILDFNESKIGRIDDFPLVIKPKSGNGAKGFSVVNNSDELKRNVTETKRRFGPFLIQEYIPQSGRQFQVEMLLDKNGECKLFVLMDKVRWYPLNGGSSTLNVTLHNDSIRDNCIRLLQSLSWKGYASLDLIEDPRDGSFKVMEINPRMNGTYKICFASGVDLASSLLEDALEEDVVTRLDYKDDVRLRVFFKDFLWFLKSKERFKCRLSWFSFKNTVDEFISLDDPKVGIRYFLSCFKRLKEDKKNRM